MREEFRCSVRTAKPQYLLGIGEDITSQKEAEESIRQAKDEAERANRSKSEFLSRMSHELRTPLNAILGFGQLLELENLNEEQQESVRHIMSGGRHLLGLINEVLDIARIEAGRMAVSLEPVSLSAVLKDVTQLVAPLARERSIRDFPAGRRARAVCLRGPAAFETGFAQSAFKRDQVQPTRR